MLMSELRVIPIHLASAGIPVPCRPEPQPTAYAGVPGTQTMMSESDAAALLASRDDAHADWLDLSNTASALYVSGRDEEALTLARRVVALSRNPSTLLNLSIILEGRGEFDEAFTLISEAHTMDPANWTVGEVYSTDLIRMGRWGDAWPIYERYHINWGWLEKVLPQWEGDEHALAGRRLLVIDGGGYGDNILFLRWFQRLRSAGAHITYVCPHLLAPLVVSHPWIDEVIPNRNHVWACDPGDYDLYTSVLSLAGKFQCTSPSLIPWHGAYLWADPTSAKYRRMCLDRGPTPRIGLCTRAGESAYPRRYKTLSREQSLRVLRTSSRQGTVWVDLQFDEPLPKEYDANPNHPRISILNPVIKTWADTAAIIDNLDLVVTVDTGVAHLSGAMGKPTWLILSGRSSWPFMQGRTDSPWYPTMRLFRNDGPGIDNAVDKVCAALAALDLRRPM